MASRDFSMYGAVDLGARQAALKKQQERQQQPAAGGAAGAAAGGGTAAPGGGAGGVHVLDVTDETFNTDVVERSARVPVLVDFWAEWCGPCKQLGPILEKLAAEAAGAWVLAKVDVDANPQLAAYMQQMGVRGIPFVAVVVAGQLMPFLNGAAPEADVRSAIDQLFEALRREGIVPEGDPEAAAAPVDAEEQPDPLYAEAEDALARGDSETAVARFRDILAQRPDDPNATAGLALAELTLRVSATEPRQALADAEQRPADVAAQTLAADVEMLSNRPEAAFERLVATVRRTAGDDRDRARVHLLGLLEMLPADDPAVAKGRRALQAALF